MNTNNEAARRSWMCFIALPMAVKDVEEKNDCTICLRDMQIREGHRSVPARGSEILCNNKMKGNMPSSCPLERPELIVWARPVALTKTETGDEERVDFWT